MENRQIHFSQIESLFGSKDFCVTKFEKDIFWKECLIIKVLLLQCFESEETFYCSEFTLKSECVKTCSIGAKNGNCQWSAENR